MPLTVESPAQSCGGCGRELRGERPGCLYCGWEPGRAEAQYGAVVRETDFRQGATLGRFVLASSVLLPLGITLLRAGLESRAPIALSCAALALCLGPGVALLQLWRRLQGRIETRQEGILLGAEELAWSELEEVRLVTGFGSRQHALTDLTSLLPRGGPAGMLASLSGGRGVLGVFLAPILFVYYVVVPGLALLSPWHERVILSRTRGDRVVLHDVQNASGLVNAVRAKLDSARS